MPLGGSILINLQAGSAQQLLGDMQEMSIQLDRTSYNSVSLGKLHSYTISCYFLILFFSHFHLISIHFLNPGAVIWATSSNQCPCVVL